MAWRGALMSGSPVPDTPRPGRRGRRLRSYLVALIVVFVVAAASGVLYGWLQARRAALDAGRADAAFAARLAATDLRTFLAAAQQGVGGVATTQGLSTALRSSEDPTNCNLAFGDPTAGHIDLVRPNGTVACSSRDADPAVEYAATPWFARALAAPLVDGP